MFPARQNISVPERSRDIGCESARCMLVFISFPYRLRTRLSCLITPEYDKVRLVAQSFQNEMSLHGTSSSEDIWDEFVIV